jgi:hypothetical protein
MVSSITTLQSLVGRMVNHLHLPCILMVSLMDISIDSTLSGIPKTTMDFDVVLVAHEVRASMDLQMHL